MRDRILGRDYKRTFVLILLSALILGAAAGISIPVSLRVQISEKSVLRQQAKEQYQQMAVTGGAPNGAATGGDYGLHDYLDDQEDTWASQMTPLTTANYILIGVMGGLVLIWLVWYWASVMGWLYQSADRENMNCPLWTILGSFFNFLAVFAFLIVRGRPDRARTRPYHP